MLESLQTQTPIEVKTLRAHEFGEAETAKIIYSKDRVICSALGGK